MVSHTAAQFARDQHGEEQNTNSTSFFLYAWVAVMESRA